jgi:hypothetical protein
MEIWDLWYPRSGATGLHFARARIDPTDRLIVHAVPEVLGVEVSDVSGARRAYGRNLERTLRSPMCLLTVHGPAVAREDIWPTEEHIGLTVILPGGEAGVLKTWWNAEDRKEWRWDLELSNSIRD